MMILLCKQMNPVGLKRITFDLVSDYFLSYKLLVLNDLFRDLIFLSVQRNINLCSVLYLIQKCGEHFNVTIIRKSNIPSI